MKLVPRTGRIDAKHVGVTLSADGSYSVMHKPTGKCIGIVQKAKSTGYDCHWADRVLADQRLQYDWAVTLPLSIEAVCRAGFPSKAIDAIDL